MTASWCASSRRANSWWWRVTAEAAVRAVDERARRVYFMANLPSPLERQLYSVSLDKPGQRRSA